MAKMFYTMDETKAALGKNEEEIKQFAREGRLRYRCWLQPPIHVARSGDRGRDVGEALARFAAALEAAIRRDPHQWFCFRALWIARSAL